MYLPEEVDALDDQKTQGDEELAEEFELYPEAFREIESDVEVDDTGAGKEYNPHDIEGAPGLGGECDFVSQQVLHSCLFAYEVAAEQDEGKEPVDDGGLPLEVAGVVCKQGCTAEDDKQDKGEEVNFVHFFCKEPEQAHLQNACRNEYGSCSGKTLGDKVGDDEYGYG